MLRFSTYEESFDELLENEGLKKKAAKSGISLGTLKKVYNRGMAAWRTGHRPGTTPQQWGMARVNSYITKGKGTYHGADKDLRDNVQKEATVKEISKNLAKSYIGKASRDVYHKGQQQGNADAISKLGGPDQDYKKSAERKAAKRVAGIDKATNRLMKKEAMTDAEKAAHQKAIDAFKAKGGKIKKLKPGYAQGYHGKADPGAGIKGMISKDDTSQFGTKKKVGSMK